MVQGETQFKIFFAVGVIILIGGLVLLWYPVSVIGGLEERLGEADLSQDLRGKLEGSSNSWRIWQITTFQPLSYVFLAVGIIIILYSVIVTVFSIMRGKYSPQS